MDFVVVTTQLVAAWETDIDTTCDGVREGAEIFKI